MKLHFHKRYFALLLVGVVGVIGIILYCNLHINQYARPFIYDRTDSIPGCNVGLLLGTSPKLNNGQNNLTIISQRFHNERAIYLAGQYGIHANGFNAQDVNIYAGFKTQIRELLARVNVYVDIITNKQPRHLGKKVHIPSN